MHMPQCEDQPSAAVTCCLRLQALPLVSTFWGIVLFGEYRRSTKKTYGILAAMLLMFAAAVGLLIGSAGTRAGE